MPSPLAPTSPSPLNLHAGRAEGVWIYDKSGKKYLDLIAGIAVNNLGHGHPAIVQAIKEQTERHLHVMVYGEFRQDIQEQYAAALTENLPETLNSVYFTNSGSEAVEGALKLAKRHTGRTELVAFANAYHGSTHGALSVTGSETLKNAFRPLLPGVRILPFNDEDALREVSEHTAAVIAEPIQGEAGVIPATDAFLTALRKQCDRTAALLLFDEAQSGFGRTGKLFALERYGVVPDVLILAKAAGGGMPLGAFIARRDVMASLASSPALGHITTFGGHPVCCAAGLAHLAALLAEGHIATVAEKERLFREKLRHPRIKEVRGCGLLLAAETSTPGLGLKIARNAMANGLLTDWFLFCDSAVRIAPPLTISNHEIEEACAKLLDAIEKA